ncbi:unnamed protein product, partial [Rhizoctonia solani]
MVSLVVPSERPSSEPKPEYCDISHQRWACNDEAHTQTPQTRYDNVPQIVKTSITIRRGIKLGSGGFGHVFRAVQIDTRRIVALKQSRASLKLKRPVLQHEANVLKILSGHPNIPELLYRSLRDVVKAEGPLGVKTVANVAYQMID